MIRTWPNRDGYLRRRMVAPSRPKPCHTVSDRSPSRGTRSVRICASGLLPASSTARSSPWVLGAGSQIEGDDMVHRLVPGGDLPVLGPHSVSGTIFVLIAVQLDFVVLRSVIVLRVHRLRLAIHRSAAGRSTVSAGDSSRPGRRRLRRRRRGRRSSTSSLSVAVSDSSSPNINSDSVS